MDRILSELINKEGNKKEFNYKGFDCCILRPRAKIMGHLNGYVKLDEGHKYYNKDYDDILVEVHGGLTFSNLMSKGNGYLPEGFWIGFDCAHFEDLIPMMSNMDGTYRNMEYVEQEIKNMVDQLL